jgi:hypothetical protein
MSLTHTESQNQFFSNSLRSKFNLNTQTNNINKQFEKSDFSSKTLLK